MPKLTARETLAQYDLAAMGLLAQSNKDVLDRTARLLASYVAHYQLLHGVIPAGALVGVNGSPRNAGQAALRGETLRVLAAALTLATAVNTAPQRKRKKKRVEKRSRS